MDVLTNINHRATPQSRQADPRQARNNAGGHVFTITPEQRVRRFLTLGTDSGTYYASARDLTADNAQTVIDMARNDPRLLVDTIVDVSTRGAAPRQNPALFALAAAASVGDDRAYALDQLHLVARTGTHLFLFARYVEQFRGWGRGLRRAVASWYTRRDVDHLAYQAVKYRQREGWSHRDLLRLAHPHTLDPATKATFEWICRGTTSEATPSLIGGFLAAQAPGADMPALIREHSLTWEMLPDATLTDTATWEALLDVGMGATALMRQLPRLTRLGLLPPVGGRTSEVANLLADPDRLRRGRVHPVNVLVAQRTYASGHSARGDSEWAPTRQIIDALDAAFYAAIRAVEPSGKRTMLALDVSGSMGWAPIANMPITPREASAALALVQLATEPDAAAYAFTAGRGSIAPLPISPRQRLDDAIRVVTDMPFGGTDCALPMTHALRAGLEFDHFVVYTDNETWAGRIHPHQALQQYRNKAGIPARLTVVGMTATDFSIADPSDPGMLDVAGFDAAVPQLIADFARGL